MTLSAAFCLPKFVGASWRRSGLGWVIGQDFLQPSHSSIQTVSLPSIELRIELGPFAVEVHPSRPHPGANGVLKDHG